MRTIRFRAWLKLYKKMVEITKISFEYRMIYFEEFVHVDEFGLSMHVDNAAFECVNIMEYTEIIGKNGSDICESDILKSKNGRTFEVKFGCYKYALNKFPITGWYAVQGNCYYPLCNVERWMEVIGNIYDNPELLKEGETK